MEIKHTPTPWVASGRYIGTPRHMSYVGEVRDENGNWSDTAKSSGDAAFIVRACNAHGTLVAALKLIIETAANAPGREACANIATEALAAAEAA